MKNSSGFNLEKEEEIKRLKGQGGFIKRLISENNRAKILT